MSVSARLVQFDAQLEGFVSTWYLDPTGTPTIGYGFTWGSTIFRNWWMSKYNRKMQRGDTISRGDADAVLKMILEQEVDTKVSTKFPGAKPNVREGSDSAVYNFGPGGLNWQWANAIARGDITGGATLLRSTATTSKGKRLPGLVQRRNEEADVIQYGRWPAWLNTVASTSVDNAPAAHVYTEDMKQAQLWLEALGYNPGPADGVPGQRTIEATTRFQQDHGTLVVDGKIGPATLSALQRAVDLKNKGKVAVAVGTVITGAGIADKTTNATALTPATHGLGWIGDVLLWGGVTLGIVALVYFSWKYRDEILTILRRL